MAKYEVEETLRLSIIADMDAGFKWGEIAKKYDVSINLVQSVCQKERKFRKATDMQNGTLEVTYYKGERLTDGKASPVTKFNINDLSEDEKKRLGFLK